MERNSLQAGGEHLLRLVISEHAEANVLAFIIFNLLSDILAKMTGSLQRD